MQGESNIKFILSFVNCKPEEGHCRPKHVGGVPHFLKLLLFFIIAQLLQ
jgi:hypothetical protein